MATYTITVEPGGQQFRCPDSKSVLVGMEYLGADCIQIGCRNGGCGVCRVQVLAGTYAMKRMSKAHVSDDDLAAGIVLSCRIFPTADLTVQLCPRPAHTTNTHQLNTHQLNTQQ